MRLESRRLSVHYRRLASRVTLPSGVTQNGGDPNASHFVTFMNWSPKAPLHVDQLNEVIGVLPPLFSTIKTYAKASFKFGWH